MKIPEKYRPCVGIIILNQDRKVFVANRLDVDKIKWPNCWQFPQGGIDDQEDPKVAALRELREETGIKNVKIIDEHSDWLYYDMPDDLVQQLWNGRYLGQRQKWFLMAFEGTDAEINLDQDHPEFSAWEWVAPRESINRVVDFKLEVYKQVITYFSRWFE